MYNEAQSRLSADQPGYGILFVGLVCFVNDSESRLVLLPDGRNVPAVKPHSPAIVVDRERVLGGTGWQENDESFIDAGIFELPECTVEISAANNGGSFNPEQHEVHIPRLRAADPKAEIAPNPNAVVRMKISSGTLEAFRTPDPNPNDPNDAAVISRLRVPHDGEILVTVDGGADQRTLRLAPGTDIALANLVLHDSGRFLPGDHFSLYGQLTKDPIKGTPPVSKGPQPPTLKEKHPIFGLGFGINDGGVKCGNTGCC